MKTRNALAVFTCLGLTLVLAAGLDARVPSKRRAAPAPPRTAEVKTPPAAPAAQPSAGAAAGAVAGAAAGAAAVTALRVLTPPASAAPVPPVAGAAPAPPGAAAVPATATGTAAAPTPPPPYSYSPAGKSDPFQPFVEVDLAVKKEKERRAKEEELRRATLGKRPISPLQQAEISKFRLVGIAGDDKQRMAIVKDDAAKKSYPLVVGTHIGPNGGRVVSIMSDRLIIEEPLPPDPETPQKRKQTRKINVLLHQNKEEERKP